MTREGIKKCIIAITRSYPNSYKGFEEKDFIALIDLWGIQFFGWNDLEVFVALNVAMAKSIYPPTYADINAILYEKFFKKYPTDEQAWEMVYRLRFSSDFIPTEKETQELNDRIDALPELIKGIISKTFLNNLGDASGDNAVYMKRDFLKSYHDRLNELKDQQQVRQIEKGIGRSDGSNSFLIDDRQREDKESNDN